LTIWVAPTVAALGLIATFIVVRARYREKQSLYETLRQERREQIERARQRAGEVPELPPTRAALPARPASTVAALAALVVSLVLVLLGVTLALATRSGSL
jgi:hypothetical protein